MKEAKLCFKTAIDICKRRNLETANVADIYINYANVFSNPEEQKQLYATASAIYTARNLVTENAAWVLGKLGLIADNPAHKLDFYKRAIAVYAKAGIENQDVADIHFNLALLLRSGKDPKVAKSYGETAMRIYEKVLKKGDPKLERVKRELHNACCIQ